MDRTREGLTFGVGAYALWGLFPLFWPLLEPASAPEVLAHRVLWSLALMCVLLRVARGWPALRAVEPSQVRRLAVASVLLASNWGLYIYGVNSGQVVETSLGYFITPLVSVALGVVVLGERLRPAQQLAIGFAVAAVAVLTVENGRPPYIALGLALSFGTYGLLKKQANVGALASLSIETAVTAPLAAAYLLWLALVGSGTFTGHGPDHVLLLLSSGVVTAVPLLLFGAAATRVPLVTLGVLQYLAPTLQLLVGLSVRHEPFGPVRLVGFGLVWVALAVFSADLLRHHRRVRVVAC
ncbi:MAG TPA: EamA family transporter RarD [Mycobacteriales bacterium]|nr:EamA family transporter RarD [Mycobacteriales bacterium]